MTFRDKLTNKLESATAGKRTRQQLEDLLVGGMVGTAKKLLLLSTLHAALIWLAVVLAALALKSIAPAGPCGEACFVRNGYTCCPDSNALRLRIAVLFGLLFLGSLFSTAAVRQRQLSHSALVTAMVLVVLLCLLASWEFELRAVALLLSGSFLALFAGYRTGRAAHLRLRRRPAPHDRKPPA